MLMGILAHSGAGPGTCSTLTLTRHGLLIADTLVEAAAQLFAAVAGDIIVADVVERNVTHCKHNHPPGHTGTGTVCAADRR